MQKLPSREWLAVLSNDKCGWPELAATIRQAADELEGHMARVGFDEQGREWARIEMKDRAHGGPVKAEFIRGQWHAEIELGGGRVTHGLHEFRDGAILLALAKAMGMTVTIEEWRES